jgi:hypothetical protein
MEEGVEDGVKVGRVGNKVRFGVLVVGDLEGAAVVGELVGVAEVGEILGIAEVGEIDGIEVGIREGLIEGEEVCGGGFNIKALVNKTCPGPADNHAT